MFDFWKKLNPPITVLAPMDDVTDMVFREIIQRIAKPDVMFTEFTSAEALCSNGYQKIKHKLAYSENQRPIVAQIWGYTPDCFEKAARIISEHKFDGIDINMGCPVKDVMQAGSGAALVNNKDLSEKLIKAVRLGAPDIPLSVKTRIDNTPKETEEWITFLLSQDINALTIHARTAQEMSKVPAHWEELGKAVQLRNKINKNVTLLGNGDVHSYKDILNKHDIYGVDGVMVGRGIFHDPWLFNKSLESSVHTTKDYINLLLEHTKLYNETWGNSKNYEVMKKFFKIYVKDFRGATTLRQKLMETRSYGDFCSVMNEWNRN